MNRYILFLSILIGILTISSYNSRNETSNDPLIKRVRIDFTNQDGFVRHLLLGFTENNAATDGIDMGYDAVSADFLFNDLNWMIEGQRFIIQGVGQFNSERKYSLGLFMEEAGEIEISLDKLENFEKEIPVYLYDKFNDEYTLLNETEFKIHVEKGEEIDRFQLAFTSNNSTLELKDIDFSDELKFFKSPSEGNLTIRSQNGEFIDMVSVYGIEGKRYFENIYTNQSDIDIPTDKFRSNTIVVKVKRGDTEISKLLLID